MKIEIVITDISMIKGTNYHMGIDDMETIRKKYKNKIIATHLRDDTREELKKKCLKDVIIIRRWGRNDNIIIEMQI